MKTLRTLAALAALAICGSCNFDSINCPGSQQFLYGNPHDPNLYLWVGDRIVLEGVATTWTGSCDDATVVRSYPNPQGFAFSVDDTSVATVSPAGEVTARAAGKVNVTATWGSEHVTWNVLVTPPVARIATTITPADTAQLNQTVTVIAETVDAAGNAIPNAPLSLVSIFVSSPITSRSVSAIIPYTARSFSFDAIWHGSYAITLASPHSVGSSVTAAPRIYVP